MIYTALELSEILDGQLKASPGLEITKISSPKKAKAGHVVCIFDKIDELPPASLFVVSKNFKQDNIPTIIVDEPKAAFIKMLNLFNPYQDKYKEEFISKSAIIHTATNIGSKNYIHDGVVISENCSIGDNCVLYPNVYVAPNAKIGNNVVLKSGVVIEADVEIGNNVIIHSGSVIGSDGFGYMEVDGKRIKIPQIGNVIVEDDVEIGSNVCIDRATIDSTIIRKGTKIDNLVQIAHNCEIGEDSIIVSQTGISGSCKIGKSCILSGQVGISDHVEIDDGNIILSKTGVNKSLKGKNKIYFGYPATEATKMRKIIAIRNKLPKMYKKLKELEDKCNN